MNTDQVAPISERNRFTYTSVTTGAAIAQITAGIIMDAVSALFFVQSKSAQTSMGEFFDKLRRDHQQAESGPLRPRFVPPSPASQDFWSRAPGMWRHTNDAPTPFVWTKTADDILASVAKFCQRMSDPGH